MTKFAKGKSGNPKGRPPRSKTKLASAFDIIFDRTITVQQNGELRDLTVEEALQLKTYQSALAGDRPARRDVLKMIAKREQWLAKRRPTQHKVDVLHQKSCESANPAMLILGIITQEQPRGPEDPYEHFKLETWAVDAALRRMRKVQFSDDDLEDCKRCTRDPDGIAWPDPCD